MQKRIKLIGIQEFNRVVPTQYQILISKTVAVAVNVWFLVRPVDILSAPVLVLYMRGSTS